MDAEVDSSWSVRVDEEHLEGPVRVDSRRNFTRVHITGERPEPTVIKMGFVDAVASGLDKGWRQELEDTTTQSKRYKNRDDMTVDSVGTVGLSVAVSVDPAVDAMETYEWDEGLITFGGGAESGNSYPVVHNTGTQYELGATAWLSGGPAIGDTLTVKGNAVNGNGHRQVGRRWKLTDPNKAIPPDACIKDLGLVIEEDE